MPMFLRSALSLIESVGWYACAIALESATQSSLAPSAALLQARVDRSAAGERVKNFLRSIVAGSMSDGGKARCDGVPD
jgi:hypothetical protein